jgi:hypothetical protein
VIPTSTPTPVATPSVTATSTSTTPAPTPKLDPFQCYEVDHAVFKLGGLSLVDRFGPSTVDVIKPKRICNPADKNGEDPNAPSDPDHLVGYVIKQTDPRFVPVTVTVTNEFGTVTVRLTHADVLLVPSAKSLTGPPDPIVPSIDHFKCYKASGTQRVPNVSVVDEFATLTLNLRKPYRLCTAVDKRGEGILDPDANLLCYKVAVAPGTPTFFGVGSPVYVDNQFEQDAFDVTHVHELCVPSAIQ